MTGKFLAGFLTFASVFLGATAVLAQQQEAGQSNIVKINVHQAEIDKIVTAFAAKETEFRQALNEYGYRREARIQSIGFGGQVSGEYRRDSVFVFTGDGNRFEKVLFAPLPTLTDFGLTAEDLQDLNGVNQFALEAAKINQYKFTLVGKEKIDELNLYVFDVEPKVMPDAKKIQERFFQGRIWVDDQDLQIVKSKGKGVPEGKQRFPVIETWRENIDGKFWFPTYAYGNGEFIFDSGQVARYKVKIQFKDYSKGRTTVKVLDGEEVVENPPKKPE